MARARFFTIEEAARVLRIGRTAAYQGARRYRDTDGAEGLPVVLICGSLRVPGGWLEEMAGGPIDLDELTTPVTSLDARRSNKTLTPPTTERPTKPKRTTAHDSQTSLPFTG